MKIVFLGTPVYTIPILDALNKTFREKNEESPIKAVVTQPPAPTGRDQILAYSAVDTWAHKKNIPKYFDPNDIVNKGIDAEIGILAAYGKIIPESVIKYFKYGILNVHPSLLPEFRGASPVQATIATNSPAGASIIKLDSKMDHGPIVTQFKDEIGSDETTAMLRDRLFERSAEVFKTLIPAYLKGKINLKKQDDKKATFTTLTKKQHGFINWKYLKLAMEGKTSSDKWEIPFIKNYKTHYSPTTIYQFFRAVLPWPGIWTEIDITSNKQNGKKRLKILAAHYDGNKFIPDMVQLEGKNPVTWKEFKGAYPSV